MIKDYGWEQDNSARMEKQQEVGENSLWANVNKTKSKNALNFEVHCTLEKLLRFLTLGVKSCLVNWLLFKCVLLPAPKICSTLWKWQKMENSFYVFNFYFLRQNINKEKTGELNKYSPQIRAEIGQGSRRLDGNLRFVSFIFPEFPTWSHDWEGL